MFSCAQKSQMSQTCSPWIQHSVTWPRQPGWDNPFQGDDSLHILRTPPELRRQEWDNDDWKEILKGEKDRWVSWCQEWDNGWDLRWSQCPIKTPVTLSWVDQIPLFSPQFLLVSQTETFSYLLLPLLGDQWDLCQSYAPIYFPLEIKAFFL